MLGLGLINKPKTDIGAYLRVVTDDLKLYMPYKDKGGVIDFVGEGSCNFDGGDYILCGDDTSLDITDDITMMAWVKPASAGQNAHIIGRDDGSNRNYVLYVNGNVYSFDYFVSGTAQRVSSTTADTANVWVHLACTRHKATGKNIIYVNGVAEDSDADSTAAIDNDDVQFSIGARDNATSKFTGSLKNIAIWNRALTATEVQNVMYKTYYELYGRLASGLVSWWTLEKALTGTTTKDVHGSNNGTLGDGLTAGTYPTFTSNIYGGATPVTPRAVDNSPKVQADAIGSGSALFDASNESVDIASQSAFTSFSALNSGSITAWIKLTDYTAAGNQAIIGNNGGANGSRGFVFYYYGTDDNLRFHLTGGSDVDITSGGDASIADNDWHHVAVVRTSAPTTAFYVDGVLTHSNTTAQTSESGDSSQILQIGCSGTDTLDFAGNICQVGYWSAALTQAQIQSIMEKTYSELTASEKTNLVSYWALDVDGSDSHGDNDGTLT